MKPKIITAIIWCSFTLFNSFLLNAQPFGSAGDHTAVPLGTSGAQFGYYEYLPLNLDLSSGNTYPLVITYHGYGVRGNGTTDLPLLIQEGPPLLIEQGMDFEAIIISPQTFSQSGSFSSSNFLGLYNYLTTNYPIDTNRVYVTGLSAGGGSTWNALMDHSNLIAAAAPICGTVSINNPSNFLQQTPIWAFHNFDDPVIDKSVTISNVNKIANIGSSVMSIYSYQNGNLASTDDHSMQFNTSSQNWSLTTGPNQPADKLSFTLYKDGGHDAWTETYANPLFWNWMFAQSLTVLNVEEEMVEFKLFPNPTSGIITLKSKNGNEKKVEIFNLYGIKIYTSLFFEEISIDLSSYSSGVYFIKVIDGKNIQKVTKIVLK